MTLSQEPSKRTKAMYAEKATSQETLRKVLTQFDKEIDFDKNMLIVCCMRASAITLDEAQYDKGAY